jgi:hypothetical protein
VPNDAGFTGIYAEGSNSVILRLSETNNLSDEAMGLTPSIALKFIVDNWRSNNLFAMSSFKESDSWNFFENQMSNRVSPFSAHDDFIEFNTMHKKLLEGSRCPYGTGVSHIANKGNDGELVGERTDVRTPYELHYTSPFKAALDEDDIQGQVWYKQLQSKIAKDSVIMDVHALTAPVGHEESRRVKIAEIVLRSDLHTSAFGDEHLYF